MIDMLQALEKFAAVKALAAGEASEDVKRAMQLAATPELVEGAERPTGLVRLDGDAPLARVDALEELEASIDAGARTVAPRLPRVPLASPRVNAALAKLNPKLDADDETSLENARKLLDFLLRRGDAADLTDFGAKLASKLAEKQVARTFGAIADLTAPP